MKGSRNGVFCAGALAFGAVFSLSAFADFTHVWSGGSGNFSAAAMWRDASGNAVSAAPGAGSRVSIPSGSVSVDKAFTVAELSVSGGTVTWNYGDATTPTTASKVTGDVTLSGTAKLTHTSSYKSSSPWTIYKRLVLEVGGDMTIASGAAIDVSGCGYGASEGPGKNSGGWGGGSHGGWSGGSQGDIYGTLRAPVTYGSGGKKAGGGAVQLTIGGQLTIDGSIKANGTADTNGGGAGGSVFITAGSVLGAGLVSVEGLGSGWAEGGGGRIAIIETTATESSAISVNAAGCSPGTVYYENAADTAGIGMLVLPDSHAGVAGGNGTWIDDTITGGQNEFKEVRLGEYAQLLLKTGYTLSVRKGWKATANASVRVTSCGVIYEGTVALVGDDDFTFAGTNKIQNLTCMAAGKSLFFAGKPGEKNTKLTITTWSGKISDVETTLTGSIKIRGTSDSPIVLKEADGAGGWLLEVEDGVTPDFQYLRVRGSEAARSVTAYKSTDLGDNVNWSFVEDIQPGDLITWTGWSGTNWLDSANWRDVNGVQRIPCATDAIRIQTGAEHNPYLTGGEYQFNSLSVESGAEVKFIGTRVTVTNTLTAVGSVELINGAERASLTLAGDANFGSGQLQAQDGSVILSGAADQTFTAGAGAISLFVLAKTGGTVTFPNGLVAGEFRAQAAAGVTVKTAPGKTLSSAFFTVVGLALKSTEEGKAWFVEPTDLQSFYNVTVQDSTAITATAYANSTSTDAGGNSNWAFGADRAVFTGNAGTRDFHTAENWTSGKVPDANTFAYIVPSAGQTFNVEAAAPVAVSNLVIGTGAGTASFATACKLTVGGDLTVGGNGSLTLDCGGEDNVVGGNVLIQDGATLTHSKMMADKPEDSGSDTEWGHSGKKWDSARFANYARFRLAVGGSFTLEEGAVLDVSNKGYAGLLGPIFPAPNEAVGRNTSGHASRAFTTAAVKEYDPTNYTYHDSLFAPIEHGSGGVWNDGMAHGGGVVRIVAGGDVTIDGEIYANAPDVNSNLRGAGGSVHLVAGGTFAGAGTITANGGSVVTANPTKEATSSTGPGGGGVISVDAGRSTFTGTMTATGGQCGWSGTDSALCLLAGGGYVALYDRSKRVREVTAAMETNRLTETSSTTPGTYDKAHWPVYFDREETPLPMGADYAAITNGGDTARAVLAQYRPIRLSVGPLTAIDLKCDLTIEDLDFTDGSHPVLYGSGATAVMTNLVASVIRLNGHTLTLKTTKHLNGRGWAAAPKDPALAYSLHVIPGEDADGHPGKIVWASTQTVIRVR